MPETLNLNYYYGNEADQYSFYRIPKILLTDRRYKGVSLEAKVLYGLLIVRQLLRGLWFRYSVFFVVCARVGHFFYIFCRSFDR